MSPPLYYLLGSDSAHVITLIDSPDPRPVAGLFHATYYDKNAHPAELISGHDYLDLAYESMAKLGRMDREPNIVLLLAHDVTIDAFIPPGDFIPLDGNAEEVKRLKARDRTVRV